MVTGAQYVLGKQVIAFAIGPHEVDFGGALYFIIMVLRKGRDGYTSLEQRVLDVCMSQLSCQ